MMQFEIIPAIDLMDGKCVRLKQGNYSEKSIYSDSPLEVALKFQDAGVKRLHVVDLDGAKAGQPRNLKTLEQLANNTRMVIDFGGGISGEQQAQDAFNAGAAILSVGSFAAKQPEQFKNWLREFGPDKFLLAADVKKEDVKISGWQQSSGLNLYEFVEQFIEAGLKTIFCTDIATDGMLQGPSMNLYKKLVARYKNLNVIASGGVSSAEDITKLAETGCSGVIVGKAIYENRITLNELTNIITNAGKTHNTLS